MEHDYSQFQDPAEGGDMARLQALAQAQFDAEARVAKCEEELKTAQKLLADIAEKELPELMDKLRLSEFKTDTGLPVKILDKIRASIPKAREREAFKWLRDSHNEKLIKRKVSVPFAVGEDKDAEKLLKAISKLDLPVEVEDKQEVHNQTLVAFIKRRLENGEPLPMDLFGVFRQRVSKIG